MKEMELNNCAAHRLGIDKDKDILLAGHDYESYIAVICNDSEYHNDGHYKGIPLYVFRGRQARDLFNMIGGSAAFTDMYSGKVDWDCRESWLDCFSAESKELALQVEKEISNNVSITLTKANGRCLWPRLAHAQMTN